MADKQSAGREQRLRSLAAVDEVLREPAAGELLERYGHDLVVDAVRAVIERLRADILAGEEAGEASAARAGNLTPAALVPWVARLLEAAVTPSLRRVINAGGVVVHTNLGRALLPQQAVEAVVMAASRYTDLEYSLASGARASRQDHIHDVLCTVTGAEDALAVNNNAAAVLLALAAVARGGEVLVGRGQLVEIGDGFRIPDILRESGAELVEVGTTNRTYLRDFEDAWSPRTRAVLRVHTSNYRIVGFTAEPTLEELATLAHSLGAVLVDDLGSGALADLPLFAEEPSLKSSIAAGADIITFSGDKLLGGPQAGIAVGRGASIDAMRRHPLARALRIDKLDLAALDAVLRLYLDPAAAVGSIPTLAALAAPRDAVRARAARLRDLLTGPRTAKFALQAERVALLDTAARAGAGALPVSEVPSVAVAVGLSPDEDVGAVVATLRAGEPAVVCRVHGERLVFDLLAGTRRRARGACRGRARGPGLERFAVTGTSQETGSRLGESAPVPLTLGTAGHIDHGKTTLVTLLTGKNTDRLREERRRGISIELGYAELPLPGGGHLSVVDVPGHERFVRTMVAGATGIDLFLLVVAADDGVMPQTVEHLAIIELLGVRHGVVALTKSDLVDGELLEMAADDVREFLAGTPYAACELVTVSARDGRGIAALLAALERAAARVVAGRRGGPARLPVDRVFPLKGIGTVATGTVWRGEIKTGDTLVVLPGGARTAVRSLQVHDHEASTVRAGSRAGVNLRGLDRDALHRGDWLVAPALAGHVSRRFDAWVRVLPGARPLRAGDRLRLHHGTAQYLARVAPLEGREIVPGTDVAAVVRLDGEAAVEAHDRFIVRALSPVATVGGGEVLAVGARRWRERERHPAFLAALRRGDVRGAALELAADQRLGGITATDLAAVGLGAGEAGAQLVAAAAAGELEPLAAAGASGPAAASGPVAVAARWFVPGSLAALRAALLAGAAQRAAARPERPFSSAAELAALAPALPVADVDLLLHGLVAGGTLVAGGGGYAPTGAGVLGDAQEALAGDVLRRLRAAALSPPTLAGLAEDLRRTPRELNQVLDALDAAGRPGAARQGSLVRPHGRRARPGGASCHAGCGWACDPGWFSRPPELRAAQRPGTARALRQGGPHPASRRRAGGAPPASLSGGSERLAVPRRLLLGGGNIASRVGPGADCRRRTAGAARARRRVHGTQGQSRGQGGPHHRGRQDQQHRVQHGAGVRRGGCVARSRRYLAQGTRLRCDPARRGSHRLVAHRRPYQDGRSAEGGGRSRRLPRPHRRAGKQRRHGDRGHGRGLHRLRSP